LASTLGGVTSPELSTKIGFVSTGSSSAFSTITITKESITMNKQLTIAITSIS